MKKNTQNDKVLAYMKEFGSITSLDAARVIGCLRLSARIADLRQRGIGIDSEMVTVRTRDGKARVARYTLKEAP